MAVISGFKRANRTLESLTLLHRYPVDRRGNRYHVYGYGKGCADIDMKGGVFAIAWVGGWMSHVLRHPAQWEMRVGMFPPSGGVDLGALSPLISRQYRSAIEVSEALDEIENAIRTMDAKPPAPLTQSAERRATGRLDATVGRW